MEVGEVLTSVQDEYSEEFYKYYLHDLVRSVHKSQNIKPEQMEAEYSVRVLLLSVTTVLKCFAFMIIAAY